MRHLLLVSGAVGSGKTSLSSSLRERYGARVIKTRELIKERLPDVAETRVALQTAGDKLDRDTRGIWVADALASIDPPEAFVVVDAVRIQEQIDAIRERFRNVRVQHIHLWAPEETLLERYAKRSRPGDEETTYAVVRENATEAAVNGLESVCDNLIDTARNRPEDVLVRVAAHLGLYHTRDTATVDVLVGAQWGSEGRDTSHGISRASTIF